MPRTARSSGAFDINNDINRRGSASARWRSASAGLVDLRHACQRRGRRHCATARAADCRIGLFTIKALRAAAGAHRLPAYPQAITTAPAFTCSLHPRRVRSFTASRSRSPSASRSEHSLQSAGPPVAEIEPPGVQRSSLGTPRSTRTHRLTDCRRLRHTSRVRTCLGSTVTRSFPSASPRAAHRKIVSRTLRAAGACAALYGHRCALPSAGDPDSETPTNPVIGCLAPHVDRRRAVAGAARRRLRGFTHQPRVA